MSPLGAALMFVALCAVLFGTIAALPWIVEFLGSRIPRHPKTPAGMIAFSVLHPATTGDWRKADSWSILETRYVNDKAGMKFSRTYGRVSADFPMNGHDRRMLNRAADIIDRRERRAKEAAALEQVAEQFERAYGTNR